MNETEQETLTRPTTELKRPEKLSDVQMDDLLAAFGNHEAKALTLIAMGSGSVFSMGNLHRAIINAQGQEPGWKMGYKGPFGYCIDSLSPIGLVTKETLNEDLNTNGYQITDFGKETGIPLAGLLLSFSQRHNIPLNKIFSSTNSAAKSNSDNEASETRKKRAPATTRKILYELITSPTLPVRESDLETNTKEDASLLQIHLERLNEAGLIDYQSTERNQSYSYYQLQPHNAPDQTPPVYKYSPTLSNVVYGILRSNLEKPLTSQEITDSLPEEITKTWVDKTGLRSLVSAILKNLEKEGWAVIQQFQSGIRSEINLSDEQRAVISELIETLDRFQDQDPQILGEGRELAKGIWAEPQSVSALMLRAKDASGAANKWPTSKTAAAILSIVQAHPEGITIRQIREAIEEIHDKQYGTERIWQVTSTLTDGKNIIVQTKGGQHTFFPASPPQD